MIDFLPKSWPTKDMLPSCLWFYMEVCPSFPKRVRRPLFVCKISLSSFLITSEIPFGTSRIIIQTTKWPVLCPKLYLSDFSRSLYVTASSLLKEMGYFLTKWIRCLSLDCSNSLEIAFLVASFGEPSPFEIAKPYSAVPITRHGSINWNNSFVRPCRFVENMRPVY